MVRATTTVIIERPIAEVFAALNDHARYPEWQPNVLRARHEPAGAVAVGTRIYETRRFMGMRVESVGLVTAHEAPTLTIAESAPESPANEPTFRSEYRCEALGAQTRLTFTIELRGNRLFTLLAPVIGLGLGGDLRARFRRFKSYLEGGAAATIEAPRLQTFR